MSPFSQLLDLIYYYYIIGDNLLFYTQYEHFHCNNYGVINSILLLCCFEINRFSSHIINYQNHILLMWHRRTAVIILQLIIMI